MSAFRAGARLDLIRRGESGRRSLSESQVLRKAFAKALPQISAKLWVLLGLAILPGTKQAGVGRSRAAVGGAGGGNAPGQP